MHEIDDPQAVAELEAAFRAYEKALAADDVAVLNGLFWADPRTVRFGAKASELHYGHEAIAAFRTARGPVARKRTLRNVRITTMGRDFGVANTEYLPEGSDRVGRQSQTWVRFADGWKIVAAHVSYGL